MDKRLFTLLKGMLAAIKQLRVDYIVEEKVIQSTANVTEHYRKWNSGFCEYWHSRRYTSVAASEHYLNFYWQIGEITLPKNLFVAVDTAHTSGKWGTGYSMLCTRDCGTDSVSCTMMSNQKGGAASTRYYVTGKWK